MDVFTPALEIAAAVRAKEVSPLEVADLYLARVDDLEPALNAFAHRDPERVRREWPGRPTPGSSGRSTGCRYRSRT
jgi:Asp-tRNA(Asn)/Glu-tRNA(Gln) amidotransferase A subunit family amidase